MTDTTEKKARAPRSDKGKPRSLATLIIDALVAMRVKIEVGLAEHQNIAADEVRAINFELEARANAAHAALGRTS